MRSKTSMVGRAISQCPFRNRTPLLTGGAATCFNAVLDLLSGYGPKLDSSVCARRGNSLAVWRKCDPDNGSRGTGDSVQQFAVAHVPEFDRPVLVPRRHDAA